MTGIRKVAVIGAGVMGSGIAAHVANAGVPVLLMDAAKLQGGSKEPNRNKVGSVTWDQVRTIAETKMPDLNAFKVESAMKQVAGTARSMGITVKGDSPFAE